MQKSNRTALIIGVIGLVLGLLMYFIPSSAELEVGEDGKYVLSGFQSFVLTLGTWFSLLLVIGTFIFFLYSYFNDLNIHPSFRREMRTISIYFFGALILGMIFAAIFGGTKAIETSGGSLYDNTSVLFFVSTVIWTAILLLLVAIFWSLKPLFSKNN